MGYIEKNLLADERVVHKARLHWLIFDKALLIIAIGVGALVVEPTVGVLIVAIGVIVALPPLVSYKTSEFGVTTKRVIIKVGFIQRRTLELLLRQVEAISVDQRIMGRVFNYGTITLSGTGGVREVFEDVAAPLEFRRTIQSQTT
ncbi:MAG: PH domain-containing protein [Acidobacteria bacterium]|nr:PH domain-containing protein [Acidobacteriota bacterium]